MKHMVKTTTVRMNLNTLHRIKRVVKADPKETLPDYFNRVARHMEGNRLDRGEANAKANMKYQEELKVGDKIRAWERT
jgi:hypothetical protein